MNVEEEERTTEDEEIQVTKLVKEEVDQRRAENEAEAKKEADRERAARVKREETEQRERIGKLRVSRPRSTEAKIELPPERSADVEGSKERKREEGILVAPSTTVTDASAPVSWWRSLSDRMPPPYIFHGHHGARVRDEGKVGSNVSQ